VSKKGRVLLAMSGGVDSSVAAMLLKEDGYEVIGATMKVWDPSSYSYAKETGYDIPDFIDDARSVAEKIGIPHFVFDLTEDFDKIIISNFINEYMEGRTPNPCVVCNKHIKWGTLLQKAGEMDCQYVATGHYVKIRQQNNRYIISKGKDQNKDQSYVLWGLSQENLSRTIFPLGDFSKTEIRKFACEFGINHIADKRESYDVCFIPDNDYRNFLVNKVKIFSRKIVPGNFVSIEGKVLGKHKGYPFYTVGQRKGLEIAVGHPLYVVEIIPESNTIVLGIKENLTKDTIYVHHYNLIKYPAFPENTSVITKVRYKDKGTKSTISISEDEIKIQFLESVSAVAPGQSAVFYENDDVIGGGFIK
jgi:tRNA-specific 2-thiouridylase